MVTAYLPPERFLFGVMFAVLAYLSVTLNKPLSDGITSRHFVGFVVATAIVCAFVVLSPRLNRSGHRLRR